MMKPVNNMNSADGTAHETLEVVVEAFENAWNGPSVPDVERFLPDIDQRSPWNAEE